MEVKRVTKDGHVRLKRWCNPGDTQNDCTDLTDYEVYYDSIKKQFKAKFYCPSCNKLVSVFCYPTNRMHALLYELSEGVYCIDCFEQENSDLDYNLIDDDICEIMEGVMCLC